MLILIQPPNSAASNPRSCTLLFKKHRTTIFLSLQPGQTIESAKQALLDALEARGLSEIGGASVPQAAADIELGVPVDRNDLEKGWKPLEPAAEKIANGLPTLQSVGLDDSHLVAFRFRKSSMADANGDAANENEENLGWDVEIPQYADEDEEEF